LKTLYVGNLAHETTDVDLRAAFSRFGEVVSARIVSDRRGRTKGFGYVEMTGQASARVVMASLGGGADYSLCQMLGTAIGRWLKGDSAVLNGTRVW
jgi:RNA recognition motif-containing protein